MQSSGPLKSPQPSPKRLNRRYAIFAVVGIIIVAAAASIPYFFPQSPDYTNQITTYYKQYGWTIVVPFKHTNVFSADAYVGIVEYNLTVYNTTFFPRSSDSDAKSFQQTVVNQFESQGFVHAKTVNGKWVGITNNSFITVATLSAEGSATGSPAVLVTQEAFLSPMTSSAQPSTASSSALVLRSSSSST